MLATRANGFKGHDILAYGAAEEFFADMPVRRALASEPVCQSKLTRWWRGGLPVGRGTRGLAEQLRIGSAVLCFSCAF